MVRPIRVLIAIDSDRTVSRLIDELRRGGFEPFYQEVATPEGMSLALAHQPWDLIIADAALPQFSGEAAMKIVKTSGIEAPVLFLTDEPGRNNGETSFRNGTMWLAKARLTELIPKYKSQLGSVEKQGISKQTDGMLRYLGGYDPLTHLPNRHRFNAELQGAVAMARQRTAPFALLILGLDRFRDINHTLGPQSGDLLLTQVADRFDNMMAHCSARGRLGGDEFGAILPTVNEEDINEICARVMRMLASPCWVDNVAVDVTGSIGLAFCPEHGDDANELLQKAIIALDIAKQVGRGHSIYRSASDPYSQQKNAYLGGLRNAIGRDDLALQYQPKIDLRTARTTGVEALVRWHHPQFGLIPPEQIIPVAERTGLIHDLSQWVLKSALDQCRIWRQMSLHIPVAVNLSPRNLRDPQLLEYISSLLTEQGLAPGSLELEITENVIMTDAENVVANLTGLSAKGIQVYIDDFGTGYSSLGHLKKLPVAGIKIDRSFVSHMHEDENDAAIVRSTIDLGHNLGLKVVAEGVESQEVWDQLRQMGCDAAQGYYMSQQKPPKELERWFLESPWGTEFP